MVTIHLVGNELVDERTQHAVMNISIFNEPLFPCGSQGLARLVLLRDQQKKWNSEHTGRLDLSKKLLYEMCNTILLFGICTEEVLSKVPKF
jgi:hypothetical protein